MSACQQAKAQRRKAANNYAHLCVRQRPNYKMRDAESAARHLARTVATEHRMRQNKGKKK